MSNKEQNSHENGLDFAIKAVWFLIVLALLFFGGLWYKQLSTEDQEPQNTETLIRYYEYK